MKTSSDSHKSHQSATSDEQGVTTIKESVDLFPVIGIGASAGGLEALEIFLKYIPSCCGMAFVIVQHLDPTHKGIMVELLQRVTDLPVVQVTDRLKVEPEHVYVIPSNKDMAILHGILYLFDMVQPRGLRLPIDFFFRSMAKDMQQHAIAVILSGMGSDGTLGLRDIKEKGGGVFVQEPASAKYDGMPRSAIDAGLADIIAPVEELPARIMAYLKHLPLITSSAISLEDKALSALEKVIIILRAHTGHDFSLYKKKTVYRRIERRMGIHKIEKISDYVRFLQENPHETKLLFDELLIGVTSFFRDPLAWEVLKTKAIPSLLAIRPQGGTLRAWLAGCSTGEEAYSLAIIFKEAIEAIKPTVNFRIQIFATDLDKDAIERARLGTYLPNITADISPQRLKRFFEHDDHGYRISREIRETIVFAPHNVIMDPPFTKLDILVCRNLFIYMEQELQKKLLPLFHYSLNSGGILFLGSAETVSSCSHLFEPVDSKARIFRQIQQSVRLDQFDFPASFSLQKLGVSALVDSVERPRTLEINLQSMTDQLLLKNYTPPAVLTNKKGDIVYIHGRTGKYLEPAAGKANWNIFAMAREGLRYELNILFGNTIRQKAVALKNGVIIGSNGEKQIVDLRVEQLYQPDSLSGLILTVFLDVKKSTYTHSSGKRKPADSPAGNIASMELELKQARDELFSIREEMQTSQEELKSSNEEMQSANEEMQSTNEELTTSKEEMQSLNEELQTVNQELQSKVSDLSQANNDMKNLLNSTDIATLFLDDSLNIRRFTTRTVTIIKLIATDIGRPITDIATDLRYPDLADDARQVLDSLAFSEKNVSTHNGNWFSVKIMPYRTQENKIDGLVITFSDITALKRSEHSLLESEENFRFLFESIPQGGLLFNAEGQIIKANREAQEIFGLLIEDSVGKKMSDLRCIFVREDGSALPFAEFPALISLRSGHRVNDAVLGIVQLSGKKCRWIRVNALPQFRKDMANPYQVFTSFVEIPGAPHTDMQKI